MRAAICLSICMSWCTLMVTPPARGDIHLWTFDEGEGVLADDVLGSRAGVLRGPQWTAGRKGSGLRFDGEDDYVALPDNNPVWLPTGDFTVSFWVCFERDRGFSVAQSEVLVDFNYGASEDPQNELGFNIQRRGDTGTIAFQMTTMGSTDEDLYAESILGKDAWHHIVAVRKGAMQGIYIDGQMDAWRPCSSSPIDFVGGYDDDRVNVGRYTTNLGLPRYHFKGVLDELMLFDRALALEDIRQLYGEAITLYVDGTHGSDQNDGLRSSTALATIQMAIAVAKQGDVVNVHPGVYREEVRFLGKAITVCSVGEAAVLEVPDAYAVSFHRGEGAASVLKNFVIRGSRVGILIADSSPTIAHVTVVGNECGIEAFGDASPDIRSSIFWDNTWSDLYGCQATYSCIERGAEGQGNFSENPMFADPDTGDYHLRSKCGRYWPAHNIWVLDDLTSPCVDAGDPEADFSIERQPNGGRVNAGAYGGTAFASMSEAPASADFNSDGAVDANDLVLFTDRWEQQVQK